MAAIRPSKFIESTASIASHVRATKASKQDGTCMQVPSCFDAFVARTWEAMDAVDSMNLLGRMAAIRTQIAPYVSMDTRKPYTDAKVTTYQNSMQSFVSGRRSQLEEYLPPPE